MLFYIYSRLNENKCTVPAGGPEESGLMSGERITGTWLLMSGCGQRGVKPYQSSFTVQTGLPFRPAVNKRVFDLCVVLEFVCGPGVPQGTVRGPPWTYLQCSRHARPDQKPLLPPTATNCAERPAVSKPFFCLHIEFHTIQAKFQTAANRNENLKEMMAG